MKLERVNDHQIRCTLTRSDLAARQLKISELAYGSEKAKSLFRDMMQKASFELGFEADNVPLMIEAVPISSESILLIITKVDDPEELDTRFANFAPRVHDDEQLESLDELIRSVNSESENVLDLFKKIRQNIANSEDAGDSKEKMDSLPEVPPVCELSKAYYFDKIDSVTKVAKLLQNFYFAPSSLYRIEKTGKLLLVVRKGNHTPEDFNRVCNIVSEYGEVARFTEATVNLLDEHGKYIIKDNAIQTLASI